MTRTPAGNARLFKEQYDLLKSAVNDYFDGIEAREIDVAVRISTLVHNTGSSHFPDGHQSEYEATAVS